uniref:Uncharacterized protein n=2 Tax=Clastoptera arizonana TaxID=38151 RepID=A0A1B6DF02_9HEMI
MIGSLYDSIENDYGALCTRLYRAFRPKSIKSTSSWRWRRLCCVPNIISFELCFLCTIIGSTILTVYMMELKISGNDIILERITGQVILIICAGIVGIFVIANLYSISRLVQALVFSQRRHLRRAISRLDTLKSEGFLQALRTEVNLMTEMVKCLDSFTQQQTRLVIIVDGLDSCEQDKVLLVLDAVHVLFSDANTPFIIILAIDPHVISKAVEVNSRRLLSESNIGGHDYLRNMVHLPFYLQNSGLRKVKVAQKSSQSHRKSIGNPYDNQQESTLVRSASSRRLSTESGGLSSQEKLKLSVPGTGRKGSRKLKLSESIASSLGSNLNRVGGAHELTKMLLTDDYFSDVNPRSMRRLMNVVYVTGRLLKAFQMDFNWYHLASWINITEQWPYRTSWLILSHDASEDQLDDNTSLKTLYDKIRPQIPTSKDAEPLLELDRDERKFDIFLTFHRSSLLVSDMRVFLPFTINLDPYIKKVIKEDQQNVEETMVLLNHNNPNFSPWTPVHTPASSDPYQNLRKSALTRRHKALNRTPSVQTPPPLYSSSNWSPHWMPEFQGQIASPRPFIPVSVATPLPVDLLETRLSNLSVDGVCQLLGKIDEMQGAEVSKYVQVMQSNNINGRVLLHCDLDELKKVVQMNFGDWELFRMVIVSLREHEVMSITQQEETSNNRNVRFASHSSNQLERRLSNVKNPSTQAPPPEKDRDRVLAKQSVMEKQVTLEEQMICGALQTLNEEACEDVLDEEQNALQVPDSGDVSRIGNRIRTTSQSSYTSLAELCETDVLILQSSPIHPPYWSPRDSQSAASSITNTPILSRKRRDSKTTADSKSNLKSQPNSRPVSLLVALPSEEDIPSANSSLTIPLPAEEFKNQATKISSSSLINNITSTLLGNRKTTINGTPSVTITPATSVEALSRMNIYQENVGSLSSDDESTPLVSEMSTPSDPIPAAVEFSNQGFGSPVSSEVSPTSIKSTPIHEIPMGAESSFRTLEGADAQYSLYVFGQDREYLSRFSHSISRQDAIDSENDENYSTQDDPETTV